MIRKTIIYLMTCTLLFACDNKPKSSEASIEKAPQTNAKTPKITTSNLDTKKSLQQTVNLQTNLVNNKVFLTSGINIKTGEPLIFNSVDGTEVTPCKEITLDKQSIDKSTYNLKKESKNTQPACTLTAVDPELRKIIEATRSIKKGTVLKDGSKQSIRYTVSVSILSKGSDCITEYRNGKQYQILCVQEQGYCPSIFYYNKLAGQLYPEIICPTCTTPKEVELAIIKQMDIQYPECVDVTNE